jgi:hypothetical protein
MRKVLSAEYLGDHRIRVVFENGMTKDIDLSSHISGEMYQPLNDTEYFRHFKVDWGTVVWENDADFAPEFLYEIGVEVADQKTGTHE